MNECTTSLEIRDVISRKKLLNALHVIRAVNSANAESSLAPQRFEKIVVLEYCDKSRVDLREDPMSDRPGDCDSLEAFFSSSRP